MTADKDESFREAMTRGEVVPFLRGDGVYRKVPASDFAGEDAPTDTWQVLRDIYSAAEERPETGKTLSDGLMTLLKGSAGDVYLAILYLTRLSLAAQGNRLPLKLPLRELLSAAREKVAKHREALSGKLIFPNGFVKKAALEDLQSWNEAVFLPCYEMDILQNEK